jgi:hypothetical protein
MWSTHTVEYYLARKRDEVVIHSVVWMNLDKMIPSGRSQTHKVTECTILIT